MLQEFSNGFTSVILRVKLRDSTSTSGAGLTGLTSSSTGLIISTIADVEATATAYTVAASKVETITTLGTYAAPSSTKVRFKEVDATNHPGIYEIQIADARFAVSGARSLLVSIFGATNLAQCDVLVPLIGWDKYDTRFGRNVKAITKGTVGSASTTTSVVTSSLDPAANVTDQFKGCILGFDKDTTTVNLRGQKTDITGSTSGGVLTVTALTTAPVSGDTFTIN